MTIDLVDFADAVATAPVKLDDLIPRHGRDGRPKIFPEDQAGLAKPKGEWYTRTTTFIGCLEDMTNIEEYHIRYVIEGLHRYPDLMEEYGQLADPLDADKGRVKSLAKRARERAGIDFKSEQGTRYHAITDAYDSGEDPGFIPFDLQPDFDAYRRATEGLEVVAIEEFCVLDEYRVAGTFDRLVMLSPELADRLSAQVGEDIDPSLPLIDDTKTGNMQYGRGKIAMQLGAYSRMRTYNPETYARGLLHHDSKPPNQRWGLITHLPPGQAVCDVIPVNIQKGWEAIDLAWNVREHRKLWARKESFLEPLASSDPGRVVKV